MHETLSPVGHALLERSASWLRDFHFVWAVPGVVVLAVVLALALPRLRALPSPTREHLMRAGAMYVFAAVVLEMVGGVVLETLPRVAYLFVAAIEEGTQMLSVVYAMAALTGALTVRSGPGSRGVHITSAADEPQQRQMHQDRPPQDAVHEQLVAPVPAGADGSNGRARQAEG